MQTVPASRPAVAILAAALLAGCGGGASPASSGGKLAVVAAENVWGDIAHQIGGNHVTVTSIIIDPNADPHSYETNPKDAAAITAATVVIENGAGYDDFMDKLLGTSPSSGADVLTIAATVGATGDNPNPHLWYSPDYVAKAATAIEARLAGHDQADAALFAANLQTFLAAYQPYIDTIHSIKARYTGAPVGYTERVAGYLVGAAGLRLATPATFAQAIEDGNDPSPADTAAMDRAVTQKLVRLLLYNAQVTSPTTSAVRDRAEANGVPVIGVAETIPANQPSFQEWQIDQARSILAALGG